MRHGCRVSDQTFHSAQRFGERETLERGNEPLYRRESAADLEAHHCAKRILLHRGDCVSGMILESGEKGARYKTVMAQSFNHALGVFAVRPNPGVQRTNAAKREKAVERGAGDPETVGPPG